MAPGQFERRVPLDFAPEIPADHRLVGFRAQIAERPHPEGRLWRFRLKYAALPRGIHERVLAAGTDVRALVQHPDVYWTSVDPTFLAQSRFSGELPSSKPTTFERSRARVPAQLFPT